MFVTTCVPSAYFRRHDCHDLSLAVDSGLLVCPQRMGKVFLGDIILWWILVYRLQRVVSVLICDIRLWRSLQQ